MNKISLLGLSLPQIEEILSSQPKYRAKQLYEFLYSHRSQKIAEIAECTVFPLKLREELAQKYLVSCGKLVQTLNAEDGSKKFQIELLDASVVEAVVLISKDRKTACLSSQVGCRMGCKFCRTSTMGLKRSLSCGEIIFQLKLIEEVCGKIDNIVFMGMGEPLDNIESLTQAIKIFTDEKAFALSPRRITISTCGIVPAISFLSNQNLKVRLAISLNSAIEEKRKQIMPITAKYSLTELKEALLAFQKATGDKRITLEYVLLSKVNTFSADIAALEKFASGLKVLINLIPYNPGAKQDFTRPSDAEAIAFANELQKAGLNVTLRNSKGRDVLGACGQLASSRN